MNGREALEAGRWIRFAAEDLHVAEALIEERVAWPRHACWLAQQAAEKSLKAGLILAHVPFPFTHDLDALRNLLPDRWEVKRAHSDLAALTEWAVEARYPGDWPEPSEAEAHRAVEQARDVHECMRADLRRHGAPSDFGTEG